MQRYDHKRSLEISLWPPLETTTALIILVGFTTILSSAAIIIKVLNYCGIPIEIPIIQERVSGNRSVEKVSYFVMFQPATFRSMYMRTHAYFLVKSDFVSLWPFTNILTYYLYLYVFLLLKMIIMFKNIIKEYMYKKMSYLLSVFFRAPPRRVFHTVKTNVVKNTFATV